jgi:syntaxin-binding protein 1
MKYIIEEQIQGTLDNGSFQWVKEPPAAEAGDRPSTWAGGNPSATSGTGRKKPSWATKKTVSSSASVFSDALGTTSTAPAITEEDYLANGSRIIVFMLGGVTYSEIRSCFELRKDLRREVIIGNDSLKLKFCKTL